MCLFTWFKKIVCLYDMPGTLEVKADALIRANVNSIECAIIKNELRKGGYAPSSIV